MPERPREAALPLLRGGDEPAVPGAAPRVRASWVRSRRYGVSPETVEPVFSGAPATDSLFYECGAEVLGRLHGTLADEPVGLMITDADGLVLARWSEDADINRSLDRVHLAPGFYFGERTAGTNGLGLALADRVPALVRAEEHYVASLRRYTCAAVPVLDPRSGDLVRFRACVVTLCHGRPGPVRVGRKGGCSLHAPTRSCPPRADGTRCPSLTAPPLRRVRPWGERRARRLCSACSDRLRPAHSGGPAVPGLVAAACAAGPLVGHRHVVAAPTGDDTGEDEGAGPATNDAQEPAPPSPVGAGVAAVRAPSGALRPAVPGPHPSQVRGRRADPGRRGDVAAGSGRDPKR